MKKIRTGIVLAFLLAPAFVSASAITLSAQPQAFGAGDSVEITVAVDADVPLNTFAGRLVYPPEMLTPLSVSDGGSIASLWLTHPAAADGAVSFAGFTPGGFTGRGGTLFSVVFRARKEGQATLALEDMEVLRDDGKGTAEMVTTDPLQLSIGGSAIGGFSPREDAISPESFTPRIAQNAETFGGSAYVVFSTTDKQSGVDQYEIAESRVPFLPLHWRVAQSPALLADQYLTSDIHVRAIDASGNAREEVIGRRHLLRPYETAVLLALCILLVLGVAAWMRRKHAP